MPRDCRRAGPAKALDYSTIAAAIGASPNALAIAEQGKIIYSNQAFEKVLRAASDAEFLAGQFSVMQLGGRRLQVIGVAPAVREHPKAASANLQTIGRLVSEVAHDFNNLLTGILLSCELLMLRSNQEAWVKRLAQQMRASGEQAALLTHQLLEVATRQGSEPQLVSWNDVITGCEALLRTLLGENISLETQLAPNLGHVKLVITHMQQVVLNLVLNARDAMPEGGRIRIRTRNAAARERASRRGKSVHRTVEVSIADTGKGMPKHVLERASQPFFTTKGAGHGLGLSIVQRIVSEAGGKLNLHREPDGGTRIEVRLPRAG